MEKVYNNFQNRLVSVIILSGVLNNFLNVYVYNFSYTFLIVFVVFMDILYSLSTRKRIHMPSNYVMILFLMICFYILVILSLFYSPSPKYKYIKTINFIVNCIFLVYPLFIKKLDIDKVLSVIKYVAVILSVFFIYQRYSYWLPSNAEFRGFYSKYFQLSVVYLALGVLISISLIHESFKKKWIQVFILLFLILALGSRGSFLFSVITLFCFHYQKLLKIKIKRKRLHMNQIIMILGFVSVISTVLYRYREKIHDIAASGISRFQSLINFSEDQSSLGRLDHYDYAFDMIFSSPIRVIFGYGIGSYGILNNGLDSRKYPHNIFLESWFEIGVIGVLLLIIITVSVLFFKSTSKTIKAIYVFLFLGAMKTGNITDLWLVFLFIGLILGTHKKNIIEVDS